MLAAQPLPAVSPRRKGNDHPLTVDQALLLSIRTVAAPTDDPVLDAVVRWLLGVMDAPTSPTPRPRSPPRSR
ncbi:hypothetical protein [Nocardia asiatica]|uniref:hypothetical protein n=1 Tax=Nocardia asiatica TaxID=209252 RepID=UPI003EDEDB16